MNLPQNKKAIVILGPTSSGKSDLAVELAQKFNGEIISVDSRQIFKDMDLGTGKIPGKWEKSEETQEEIYLYKNIPHHLIDFVNPEQDYNISHFKKDCEEKIFEISERGKIPILCGGTGFWIQAVVDDVVLPKVEPDFKLRKTLQEKKLSELFEILKNLDPARASTIDQKNTPRLIRAIEIAKNLDKVPVIEIRRDSNSRKIKNTLVEFLQIGISIDRKKLTEKIKARLEKRIEAGMLEEILDLYKKYDLSPDKIKNFGIAYSLVPLYQQKKLTFQELFDQIVQAEKNYAKRQLTWFKKDPRIFWSNEWKEIEGKVKEFIA